MSMTEQGGAGVRMSPDLASDLAYVRSLAEEGRDAPLLGGFFYLLWGVVIAAASLLVYLVAQDVLPLGGQSIMAIWFAAGFIGWGVSFWFRRREGAKPGAFTIGNRTAHAVWLSVGIFITIFWITLLFAHDNFTALGVPRYFLFSMMFPAAFGLYGVAFYATAVAARLDWLRGFALLSWAFSVACIFTAGSSLQFLLGAAGSLSCAALPGLLLMRQEPKEIV